MVICETEFPQILNDINKFLGSYNVELVFVNSDEMKELNLTERGIDKTTDVLSFPLFSKIDNYGDFPIGPVVINLDLAKRKANELGHNVNDEIALLFTHGFLHILGFDHETDNGEMREKEREIIENFKLPKSLIIRNEI